MKMTARPLWEKLEEAQKRSIYAVVVDAIDDEPYLSSQLNPMLKHGKEIVTALRLCARAVSASKQYVAVYKHLTDLSITIPRYVDDVRIKRIRGKYPGRNSAAGTSLGRTGRCCSSAPAPCCFCTGSVGGAGAVYRHCHRSWRLCGPIPSTWRSLWAPTPSRCWSSAAWPRIRTRVVAGGPHDRAGD